MMNKRNKNKRSKIFQKESLKCGIERLFNPEKKLHCKCDECKGVK